MQVYYGIGVVHLSCDGGGEHVRVIGVFLMLSDQQVDGVDASDHRPVVADIRFQTEEDLPENQE